MQHFYLIWHTLIINSLVNKTNWILRAKMMDFLAHFLAVHMFRLLEYPYCSSRSYSLLPPRTSNLFKVFNDYVGGN